jgi:hypothetical protein
MVASATTGRSHLPASPQQAQSGAARVAPRAPLDELAEAEAEDTLAATRVADFLAVEIPAPLWVCDPLMPGGGVSLRCGTQLCRGM